ncbi:MAG: exodeoxyribonuclease V subunit gamma, partial [Lysobacter spongiicola]|nr:exodeoxyribonuclease V subunit gamma [Lysobacter spongiicola]
MGSAVVMGLLGGRAVTRAEWTAQLGAHVLNGRRIVAGARSGCPSRRVRRRCGKMAAMPAAPDFRLYHSNSLEVLAGLLAEALREPAPGQSLLAPDIVLIPQVAMRRWLQAT